METPYPVNVKDENDRRHIRRWLATIVYTLFIFATLPIFPTVWRFLSLRFPDLLMGFTYGFVPGGILIFLAYFIFVARKKDPLFYLWSGILFFSYGPLLYFYCEFPAERLHMAEYGLLVIFVYRALKVRMQSVWIYLVTILYVFSVGLLDEIVQGILPNRFYEFKDVTINWIS